MNYRIWVAVLLAMVSLVSVAFSQAGFQDVLDTPALKSPIAAQTLFNGIAGAGKRLVCVGQRGHIVFSDDFGTSWSQAVVPVSSDLTAVTFPTPQQGWAVGHDGVVLHSSDSGATWIKQLDGRAAVQLLARFYGTYPATDERIAKEIKWQLAAGADKPLLSVWFENETTGFVVGAFNLIFHTIDGGKSWEPWLHKTDNITDLHFYAINAIGRDVYLCGEQGMVLKLDKTSGRFRALKVPYNGTFFGLTGKAGALIAHGMRGNVFLSRDDGESWQKIQTGIPWGLTGSTLTADGKIILLSQSGHLLVSKDDGASFFLVKLEHPFPATTTVALDNQTVVVAGLHGMQKQKLNYKGGSGELSWRLEQTR
jgi:photosystem II stability/assembly factor-like uncharacterized protein